MAKRTWKEPYLLIAALRHLESVSVKGDVYFQDELEKIEPFKILQFTLRKPTRNVLPEGWSVDDGSLAVLSPDRSFIGTVSPGNVEYYELKPGRTYYGYVIPPTVDLYDGFAINDNYRVNIFVGQPPM